MNTTYLMYILIFVTLSVSGLVAQDVMFNVYVSSDTILQGNLLKVKFEIKNAQGQFDPPEFDDWNIVGGPNTSTQFNMVNGIVSQSASYEYILRPPSEGVGLIGSATFKDGEHELSTDPIEIFVAPNPQGIDIRPQDYRPNTLDQHTRLSRIMSPQDSLRWKLRRLQSTKI